MKTTHTILALLAAGFLGHSAFGSDTNGPWGFAFSQDPHGGYHAMYYQTTGQPDTTSVALYTSSGGVISPMAVQDRTQADKGDVKLVIGTNQHGQANVAYIPVTSHFAPSGQ